MPRSPRPPRPAHSRRTEAGPSAPAPGTTSPDSRDDVIVAQVERQLRRVLLQPVSPGLALVATPIGNLSDITLRAIAVLARADVVYAEDTRHSAILLAHFGLHTKLAPYHEHNAARERPRILAALADGRSVALVSDAGMPLVSDPGYKLVRDCLEAGHRVTCIPGASASLAALVSSGLPTDTFLFAGFLPSRGKARAEVIDELAAIPATLVLFEAANRLAETLADLAAGLGPRQAAIARELTKLNEEVVCGTLDELSLVIAGRAEIRGEIAIVVGPPAAREVDDAAILAALDAVASDRSRRDAAREVAARLGVGKSRVYALALARERNGGGAGDGGEEDADDGSRGTDEPAPK
ncbi:MAG: 16S rRNA (cytidine(1402)-2'-O)-methyltransferase [Hyphomicrobiaceae bacterium]|nr:16S rRNA (cytidine(1402)-2'-O)-methyltransferase [Hyphomicrobiaceae bacterium]